MNRSVSAIIPVYNEETSISACLISLQGQTLKADEIIVVDDGSTDQTSAIVREFPVKFLSQKHLGPGSARNLGAKESTGDILVFVDADMTFAPDFLEKLIEPILNNKSVGTFNLDEFVGNYDQILAHYWNLNQNLHDKRRLNPKSTHDIKDFRAIKRSEFERVGGFSGLGYTDSQSLSKKLKVLPTPVKGAVSYHNNPETLIDVFRQARWIGRRPMKLGGIGQLINLFRYSLPISIIIGLAKGMYYQTPRFVMFKIVYDLGFFIGLLTSLNGSTKVK